MKLFHDEKNSQINFLDERFYTLDEVNYFPSVTTVLEVYPKGFGFNEWLKSNGFNADIILERAGQKGSRIHDAIDSYLREEEITWADQEGKAIYSLEEWLMILKFVEFWDRYQPELIANEFQLVSGRLELGGTVDILCRINDEIWLIDIKTSNYIHDSYELQLAAYATIFNDINSGNSMKVDRCGVMWLNAATRGEDKQGKKIQGKGWQMKEWPRHYNEAWKTFQHVRAIWDEVNPNYVPKNRIYPDRISLKTII